MANNLHATKLQVVGRSLLVVQDFLAETFRVKDQHY